MQKYEKILSHLRISRELSQHIKVFGVTLAFKATSWSQSTRAREEREEEQFYVQGGAKVDLQL